jgi:uncharacterized protein YfdQ (DUF2303 family)
MSEIESKQNPFATGVALTKEFLEPKLVTVGEVDGEQVQMLVVADGLRTTPAENFLQALRGNPRYRVGVATLDRLDSLIEHTNRFSDKNSAIFVNANSEAPSITSVLDYHEALRVLDIADPKTGEIVAAGFESTDPKPRFGRHRGIYSFPVSDEWKAWLEQNEEPMAQNEFAEFLEDRILDVLPPPDTADESAKALREIAATLNGTFATAQRLMELSRGLAVNVNSVVKNAQVLQSGEVSLQYEETHNDALGKPIQVPSLFVIGIPVFRFGEVYRIAVRLRYRLGRGAITWSYSLHSADRVLDHAVQEAADRVQKETGLPLFYGAPE